MKDGSLCTYSETKTTRHIEGKACGEGKGQTGSLSLNSFLDSELLHHYWHFCLLLLEGESPPPLLNKASTFKNMLMLPIIIANVLKQGKLDSGENYLLKGLLI